MKKLLQFLPIAALLITSNAMMAQNILDDFDDYDPGPVTDQADHWILWAAGGVDANVVDEEFYSAPHSLRVAEGGAEDIVLILGDDYNTGMYRVGWRMMVPEGSTGFYNHQESEVPGIGWNMNVHFNLENMEPGVATITDSDDLPLSTFEYDEGEWMLIEHVIDLDNDMMEIYVDQELVYTMPYTQSVGGINFYSIDANNLYYIDDVFFGEIEEAECEEGEELIICDNFEEYILGSYAGENADHWSTWSGDVGGAEDAMITNEVANSGLHSLGIYDDQVQDVVLQLGDRTEGDYFLKWSMYIPDSASGYYNIQQDGDIGEVWVLDVFFNNEAGDAPGVGTVTGADETFVYPTDEWFDVEHDINLDAGTINLTIAGTVVGVFPIDATGIGAANFYSLENHNTFYLDDVNFAYMGSSIGISENDESPFTLYPNPSSDIINLKSPTHEQVDMQLLDLAGHQLKFESFNGNSIHQMDISNLTSGMYVVKLIFNDREYTHKLVVR